MNDIGAILGAILCNVLAQITIKLAGKSSTMNTGNSTMDWFFSLISPWILAALSAYGTSFLLTTVAYKRNPLNIVSPMMAGAIIALTVLAGHILFKEPFAAKQMIGVILIVSGIVLATA